jgi:hypothetical protein
MNSPTKSRSRSPSCARGRVGERLDRSPARGRFRAHRQLGLCPRAECGCSPVHDLTEAPSPCSPRAHPHEGVAVRFRRGGRRCDSRHSHSSRAWRHLSRRAGTAASPRPLGSPHARQAGGSGHSRARACVAGDLVDRLTSERPNALRRVDVCLARSVARGRTFPDAGTTAARTSRDVGARCRAPVRRGRPRHEPAGGRRDLARRHRAADRRVRARVTHLAERLSRQRSVGDGGHRLACDQRGTDRSRHRALPPAPAPGAAARDPAACLRSRHRQQSAAGPRARPSHLPVPAQPKIRGTFGSKRPRRQCAVVVQEGGARR